ncbi:MAG: pyridoxal kinase PdxY [Treponema sp.]|nr:pyridoxal kinase PdxY [Treponema sp.]MCL2251133.1 pyridoxal kinase PdxY [Treponema sp.]
MAVLSIQSHVVYGYAGNTAAVFPLQRLGREVWAINTVEFSNHTGYGSWRGKALGAELTSDLVLGLEERGVLNQCEAILSGYLGEAEVAKAIINAVKKVRRANPDALYCLDPVMGDKGRGFYVKPQIPQIIKNDLVPLADIIFPNLFEMETLTGINIENTSDAIKAINTLHKMGPGIVLLTSFKETDGELSMIASDKKNIYKITTPELPLGDGVAGTGDMTAAVFLSQYLNTNNLEKTLNLCTSSVYGILEESFKSKNKKQINDNNVSIELKLIEAQEHFANPAYSFKAVKIN